MSRLAIQKAPLEQSFVACSIGETVYAVPIGRVKEIILPLPLTPVPDAPAHLLGVIDHRGMVVPILDWNVQITGMPTTDARRKWILVGTEHHTLGVVVRQVFEVFHSPESSLRRAPPVRGAGGLTTHELVSYRQSMAFVLDVDAILKSSQLGEDVESEEELIEPEGELP